MEFVNIDRYSDQVTEWKREKSVFNSQKRHESLSLFESFETVSGAHTTPHSRG